MRIQRECLRIHLYRGTIILHVHCNITLDAVFLDHVDILFGVLPEDLSTPMQSRLVARPTGVCRYTLSLRINIFRTLRQKMISLHEQIFSEEKERVCLVTSTLINYINGHNIEQSSFWDLCHTVYSFLHIFRIEKQQIVYRQKQILFLRYICTLCVQSTLYICENIRKSTLLIIGQYFHPFKYILTV